MKVLLGDTGVLIICLLFSVGLFGQQNPFDVYRTTNPSPPKSNLKDYRTPQDNTIDFRTVEESAEPERIAAVIPEIKDSSSGNFENPFDIYSKRDNPLSPIPNPLKAKAENFPEKKVDGEFTSIPKADKIGLENVINTPVDGYKDKEKASEIGKIDLKNPFDVNEKNPTSISVSEEEPPVNSADEYNIESKEKKPVQEVESSLPKDKKVKGYFNSILTNYVFWILLGFLVLLTLVININRKLIPEISKSLISDNYLRITYREYNKGFTQFVSYLLYLNFFVQAGLFAYLAQKPLAGDFTWPWYYFIGGAFGVYMVRHIVLWLLGSFFPVHRETSQFSFVIMQFNLFLGLILFGLNWLLAFGTTELSKPLIFIGLGSILFLYLIRQFRGLLLGARIVSHYKFHFFLYLCAVEFAPLMMFYKVITESFS